MPGTTERELKIKAIRRAREKQKRQCERSYYEFLKAAWDKLEPHTPFEDNWHIKIICDRLQEEVERIAKLLPKNKDLIINIPPRSLKSYMVSIMLCPWAWTRYPHLRFISSSYSMRLSTQHCLLGRRLIQSSWYQIRWGGKFALKRDQNAKSFYENDKGGARFAGSVKGGVTGHGADIVVGDDLLNPKLAKSRVSRDEANEHFTNTLFSRMNNQKFGTRILVMQRLHEDDVTGHVIEEAKDEYDLICIPAEAAEADVSPPEFKRFYQGGLFFKGRFSADVLASAKKHLKSAYAGQYNQRPADKKGNIFQREWFKFYDIGPSTHLDHHPLPTSFDKIIQSWDMSFKGLEQSPDGDLSFVVCQIWGKKGGSYYLLYQFREQIGFVDTLKHFIYITKTYPLATSKLIEDKANGPAVQDILKKKISGIIPVPVRGSKPERAEAISYLYEAGNVYIPRPSRFEWVSGFINRHCNFPKDKDDEIDAGSQALDYLSQGDLDLDEFETFLRM